MSFHQESPSPPATYLIPPTYDLAAHTTSASVLTEKLTCGIISKSDYDALILPTAIKSAIKLAYVPIIMTTDDSLAAILAQAGRGLYIWPPDKKKAKLCLCCSTRLLGFIRLSAPVTRDSVMLDRDGLKKILTFVKESHRIDQLLLAREDDIAGPEYLKMVVTHEEHREGDTHASMESGTSSSSSGGPHGRDTESEGESSGQESAQARN